MPYGDSDQIGVLSPSNGSYTPWAHGRMPSPSWIRVIPLQDGTILTQNVDTLSQVLGRQRTRRLGILPLHKGVMTVTVSTDLHRAVVSHAEFRSDAWLYHVVRP